jgi:hypothetical protein
MKFALLFVGLLAACQPQPTSDPAAKAPQTEHEEPTVQKPVVMDNEEHPAVTKVIYTEANGSLPPPSQYENNFELTAEDVANFNELVDAALDETRVNDAVSLRGYMVLRLNNDPRFAQVGSISSKDVHPTGGQSTTVKFILEDGREFEISNYAERLSGSALADLKQAAREKGKAEMPTDSLIPPG